MKNLAILIIWLISVDAFAEIPWETNPRETPYFVSESGTRYWECKGQVDPRLLHLIADEMKMISDAHGFSRPDSSLCLYKIWDHIVDASVKMYSVDYYVSFRSLETCLLENYCDNVRSVTFMPVNDGVARQYLLSSVQLKDTKMVCIGWDGNLINASGRCQ